MQTADDSIHNAIRRSALILLALGAIALAVKQGIPIARYGYVGWLPGDGAKQSEWEVRAVILLLTTAAAVVVYLLARVGMPLVDRYSTWRLTRAILRERRRLQDSTEQR